MIFNAFQREDADNVFTIVRNVRGSSISAGACVVWDISSSVDGVRVTAPATATLSLAVGLLAEALADSQYGKCLTHGYTSAAYVIGSTATINPGDILLPVNGQTYLGTNTVSDGKSGFFYAAESFASSTTPSTTPTLKKTLVRCL